MNTAKQRENSSRCSVETCKDTVERLLQQSFTDPKIKINSHSFLSYTQVNGDAQKLVSYLLNIFITEAAGRAARLAKMESTSNKVEVEHFEKILAQLGSNDCLIPY
ncbi:Centromere protein X [Trichoplax sp. H2]|nr:Centromere protein X [Trichoplax sp. H2]|eukprot:RDD42071.1 Centromere protein X [Trichoplax sp. H2]